MPTGWTERVWQDQNLRYTTRVTQEELHVLQEQLIGLPREQRLELLDELQASLEPLPEWHREVLKERIRKADENPGAGVPWEAVKAELWPTAE